MKQIIGNAVIWGVLLAPCAAQGQTPRPVDSRHAAMLSVFGGGASGAGTGGALGWSVGWTPTPRVSIEGGGWWTDERAVDGFAALIGPHVNLTSPRGVMPFVSGELGVFRASVDASEPGVPTYYLERVDVGVTRTFNDFAMVVGGGMDIFIRRHVSVRPQVRLMMLASEAGTRGIAMYGVHLSYHFFKDPLTPP